jgi:hypothetical protein
MRFLTSLRSAEKFHRMTPPPALEEATKRLFDEMVSKGIFIDGGGLNHSRDAVNIRLQGGTITVTDGPFTETKEVIGGFAIVELPSLEAVVELERGFAEVIAKHWPEWEGTIEIRRLAAPGDDPRDL